MTVTGRGGGSAARSVAVTKIAELTPHPAAHGRHPLPTGEGREYPSFSLGEKVAEERGRMRGLVIHRLFAKKISIYDLALQSCSAFWNYSADFNFSQRAQNTITILRTAE